MVNKSMKVSFLLTEDNRSGGVRVTMIMGNLLIQHGYEVRILCKIQKKSVREIIMSLLDLIKMKKGVKGWLHLFKGEIQTFRSIDKVEFSKGEIVIGVGTYMIQDLDSIKADVKKIRYNHGFPHLFDDKTKALWSLPLPTITVSQTLVPQLEKLSGRKVLKVISNGIETDTYYPVEGIQRDGIGTIYSSHPNKAPEDIVKILNELESRFPQIPRRVFGVQNNPFTHGSIEYLRYPKIEEIRRIYSSCKIWFLASYTEGFPGPVLEAMACGCIVLSSDNDGSLEIIRDGENGIIVPRGNIDAFIEKVEMIWSNSELQQKILDNSKKTVAHYSWENSYSRMDELLKSL